MRSADSFLKVFIPRGPLTDIPVEMGAGGRGVHLNMRGRNITATSSELPTQWSLQHIEYHSPSEHTVDGVRYAAERQMVFGASDGSVAQHVVFSELYVAKENHVDPMLEEVLLHPDTLETGVRRFFPTFDFQADSFMRYAGSLTAPPCDQGVHWHVSVTPHYATPQQLQRLVSVVQAQGASHENGSPHPKVGGFESM